MEGTIRENQEAIETATARIAELSEEREETVRVIATARITVGSHATLYHSVDDL